MRCEEIQEMLPGHTPDGDTTLMVRRHLASCLDCKQEAQLYEEMGASLRGLATHTVQPPAALYRSLVEIPSSLTKRDQVRTHVVRNKKAYAGGAAVLLGAAGAALWKSRARRPATA